MAKEEQLAFLSSDAKTTIHAVKWIPENGEYKAILQVTHGMAEFIERYRPFADYLTERGFLVVGHDHLGHGDSVITQEDWGYFSDSNPSDTLVEDMHRLRGMVQAEHPGMPYFMLGHSMGSYMLRKYLCIHPKNLNGAVIMGTGCVPDATAKLGIRFCKGIAAIKGWRYRSRFMQSLSYSKPYKKFDLYGKDYSNSWLTKDVEIVRAYYAEPKCTFLFTLNGYLGLLEAVYYDNQMEHIKNIPRELPLFLVSGADDPVGDLGEGVKKVYNMYKQAGMEDLTYQLFENDRHEILNETDREKVFADICAWLTVHIENQEMK